MWTMLFVAMGLGLGAVPLPAQASLAHTGADSDRSLLDVPAYLVVEDATVDDALHQLGRTSGVPLAFSASLVPPESRTTCDCSELTVRQALDQILSGTGLSYSEVRRQVVIEPTQPIVPGFGGVVLAADRGWTPAARTVHRPDRPIISRPRSEVLAQTGTIRGAVVREGTDQPLSGAQVSIPGTGRGTLTDQGGRYELGDVPAGNATVRVQMLGYATAEQVVVVRAGAVATANFALSQEAIGMDELVVTGTAGEQRRRELGSSLGVIGDRELQMAPMRDIQDVFFGRTPGVNLLANSGQPGAAGTLRLRGTNSISQGNMPLIYVDGVRISNDFMLAGARDAGVSQAVTPFNNINPEDIARIEVVRGAAASTLYGTEASGGVIQIFTHRGTAGAPQWTAQVTTGVNQIGYVGPSDEPTGLFLLQCRGENLVDSEGVRFEDPTCPSSGSWAGNGPIQQYSLSVQGGSDDVTYFLSGRFSDERSPFPVGYDRPTRLRGNFGFRPASNFDVSVNAGYTGRTTRWVPDGSNAAGFFMNVSRGNTGVYLDNDGNPHNEHGLVQRNYNWTDHFVSGLTARYQGDAITHRATVGYDFFNTSSETLYPFGNLHTPEGRMYKRNDLRASLTADYVGSLPIRFSDAVASTFSWGGQLIEENSRGQTMQGRYYASPAEPDIAAGAFSDVSRDSKLRVINAGVFLQNVLALHDRAFLTTGLRVDGHSAFGRDYGLQPYPRVGLSYVLSDHDFWPRQWWDELRLRAAVGEAGKAPGVFDAIETWRPVAGEDGQPGYSPNRLGNPDLGPERTREYEVGFETSAFDGRIGLDFTYFHQDTHDALIPVRAPPSLGFSSAQLQNVGHLRNVGTEVSLIADLIRAQNLGWTTTVNYSTHHNTAIDLGGEVISLGWRQSVREGYPVGAIMYVPKVTNPNEFAEPIIDENGYYGPTEPTLIVGLRNEFTFRQRLTLEVMGEYQGGHYQQNGTGYQNARRGNGVWPSCYDAQAALRAAEAGDPSALDRVTALDRMKCTLGSDADWYWWIQPADFFKLRSVSLSYNLPTRFLPGRVNNAALTIAGRNLLTITDYDGIDPEIGDAGALSNVRRDYYNLPPFRTFTASLRVNF
jgi:TonB-dependent starch-binding outer membrane protein SusC